jgi:hypothetical protein
MVLAAAVLTAAGAATALAQSGADPYSLPEPPVKSRQVIKMAPNARCVKSRRVKVRFTPPPGAVFSALSIDLRGAEAVRLTGVSRAASATLRLPTGRTRITVFGETLGGQVVRAERLYRTCGYKPRPSPRSQAPGPLQEGGGED